MTTTTVSSAAALNSALKAAQAGDTILLAPGTYAGVVASNLNFASDVTIASANPGAMATLTGLSVQSSSGLQFQNLDFFVNPTGGDNPFLVSRSHDIGFSGLSVHGTLNGNPVGDRSAMLVRDSDGVTVANSTFQDLWMGLGHLNTTHFMVENNTFKMIQVDGLRGGGSSYMTVRDNTFSDFRPGATDHADMIQFWTTNTTTAAHDIVITGNVMQRAGTTGMIPQGIFLNDEAHVGYERITIEGNLAVGMAYNAIAVYGAGDVRIHDNAVVGFGDFLPRIRLEAVHDAEVSDNQATTIIVTNSTGVVQSGNTAVAVVTDGGAAFTAAWLAAHDGADAPTTPTVPTIVGTDGADKLISGAGDDRLEGGAGNDTYVVNNAGDVVVEAVNAGTDGVVSSVSFTLGANVENLVLGAGTLSGSGNELANSLKGGAGANSLSGLAGNDTLYGMDGADVLNGGAGADAMAGGTGNDRFIFAKGQVAGDKISDFAAGDRIELTGFSAGSTISLMAGSTTTWIVKDAASGATEAFQLTNAYKLAAADWLFT
jgi:Ca2+-binding RTX toxin-like protein